MRLFKSPRDYCRHENLIARPELGLAAKQSDYERRVGFSGEIDQHPAGRNP